MDYNKIKEAAQAYAEKPNFSGMSELFLAGIQEGFLDGAMWAKKQMEQRIESLLEITARLSDTQELINRGLTSEAAALLNQTKQELFFRAYEEAGGGLSFSEWREASKLF